MLLIDGAKFEEWNPGPEVQQFQPIIKKHYKEIFGEKSVYVEGSKIISEEGKGSIPDAFAITLGIKPQWYIIEIELSYKDFNSHLVPQLNNFINGMKNSRNKIVTEFNRWIKGDDIRELEFRHMSGCKDIHEFVSDLISTQPNLIVVVEKHEKRLDEAIQIFKDGGYRVELVEFRTFRRNDAENIQACLFKPVVSTLEGHIDNTVSTQTFQTSKREDVSKNTPARKTTFKELIEAGLIRDGQLLYFTWQGNAYKDERATIMASQNLLVYKGQTYSKTRLAINLAAKYHLTDNYRPPVRLAGPLYWKTEDGKILADLEYQIKNKR